VGLRAPDEPVVGMNRRLGWLAPLVLAACTDSPPPIGGHLPGVFKEASDAFDERVNQRFGIGTDEDPLRRELAREGFVITRDPVSPFDFSARYTAKELVCRADWNVRWSVFAGRIAAIRGNYAEICL
jgi:hypothetical protein